MVQQVQSSFAQAGESVSRRNNSTEELLEIIRDSDNESTADRSPAALTDSMRAARTRKKSARSSGGSLFGLRKKVFLGVEIGEGSIELVKVSGGDARNSAVAEHVVLPVGAAPGSDDFIDILRTSIGRVCGRSVDPEIWTIVRSADVDVGPILIPKVPVSKVADTVYWTIRKEKKFDDREYVFDVRPYGIVKDEGVAKLEVLTGMVRQDDVNVLASWFARAGYELAGVTTAPSAFLNAYDQKLTPRENVLTALIHVDSSFSTITIFDGGHLLFSRSIKAGMDGMAEAFLNHLRAEDFDLDLSISDARQSLIRRFLGHAAEKGEPGAGLPEEDIFEIVSPALVRLARQADRTLEYYLNNFKQRCEVLHLSGEIFVNDRVAEFMSAQLDLSGRILRILPESARLVDGESIDRGIFNTAAALAHSRQDSTLNFLVNHAKRVENQFWQRLNDAVAVVGLLLALLVGALYGWQTMEVKAKTRTLESVSRQYASISPKVDETRLSRMAGRVAREHTRLRGMGERYDSIAYLAELKARTPGMIRFLSVSIDETASLPVQADSKNNKKVEVLPGVMVLDGVVLRTGEDFNTVLSKFLIGLEASPLFDSYQILSSKLTSLSTEGEVLHFVLHVRLV